MSSADRFPGPDLLHVISPITSRALDFLIRQRPRWEAGVESAEVLLALASAGLSRHQFARDAAERFAGAQLDSDDVSGSWDADFDTTAYGIMVAVEYPGEFESQQISRAADFILRDFGGTTVGHSWADEVERTLLGLRALAVARHPSLVDVAGPALLWLQDLQSGFGLLINERYTAEYVAAVQDISQILGSGTLPPKVLEEAVDMEQALLRRCDEPLHTGGTLWNNDLRANGIALEAFANVLATRGTPQAQNDVIKWFQTRQAEDGGFGGLLATARVVQGLMRLAFHAGRQRGLDQEQTVLAVAAAHRGVTARIPLALLWKTKWRHHDKERQSTILILPDRWVKRILWALSIAGAIAIGLVTNMIWEWF